MATSSGSWCRSPPPTRSSTKGWTSSSGLCERSSTAADEFELDVDELHERWADPDNIDSWSQMVIKHTQDSVDLLAEAPQSGIWRLGDAGEVTYARFDYHRRAVASEREAFFLRISGPDDYCYLGADLGVLITRGRLMSNAFRLNERAHRWVEGIRRHFLPQPLATIPRTEVELTSAMSAAVMPPTAPAASAFKIL